MELFERLLQAIKKDDKYEFDSCMTVENCGTLRLGRFPVLSVMYLYKSRRLLRAYEKNFLRYNSWRDVGEPMELAVRFRDVAGKCLRLYLNETVTPIEMLLLLDRNLKVKKVFPQLHVVPPVRQRLKDIYFIRWGLTADFFRGTIVLERRPLTRAEKIKWLLGTVSVVLCLVLIVGTPFVVNVFAPFIPDGEGVLHVARWEQIKFTSEGAYTLDNDVTVPEGFFVEEMKCALDGNGHTVTVAGNGLFGTVKGTISNVVFAMDCVNLQTDASCGLIANNNYGTITEVTVNVSGSFTATAAADANDDEKSFKCGGIVATNYYVVQNCTVNYNDFHLQGNLSADAAFGGVVGLNENWVEGCATTGVITADTFDVAGICAENNYLLRGNTNATSITQRCDVIGWNPLAAGIALVNNNYVQACVNSGAISSTSTAAATTGEGSPTVYAAGIVYQNVGGKTTAFLVGCENTGAITATADEIDASASGVCNFTNGGTEACVNRGAISATGKGLTYAAGIIGLAYGYANQCYNSGAISGVSVTQAYVGGIVAASCVQIKECLSVGKVQASGNSCYVGGILGYSMGVKSSGKLYFGYVQNCIADCEISATANSSDSDIVAVGGVVGYVSEEAATADYPSGSVTNCYFTGNLQAVSGAYVGAIVGVTDKDIYLSSAPSNEKPYFDGNTYLDSCGVAKAFGAAVKDGNFEAVSNVGAASTTADKLAADETYQKIRQIFAEIQ